MFWSTFHNHASLSSRRFDSESRVGTPPSARGSGEQPQGDPEPDFGGDPSTGSGSRTPDVFTGLKNEFAANSWFGVTADDMKEIAVQYRALGALSDPLRFLYGADYFDSIYDGVNQVVAILDYEASNCPSEKFVLAGYSQGALAIHIALRDLGSSDPAMFSRIIGVAMIADPAKGAHGAEYTLEEFDKQAGSGVSGSEGVWTKFMAGRDVGPLPAAIASKTIAICRNHDIVCAPPILSAGVQNPLYNIAVHTDSYYETNTDVLGRWIGDKYMNRPFSLDP